MALFSADREIPTSVADGIGVRLSEFVLKRPRQWGATKWKDLFGIKYDVLLYDLTSIYFESDPPENENDIRRFGYSRDKRRDCVQVVIALIVTPEGIPLAYEVLPGNTADKTTLRDFLHKIQEQYGKAERIWIMDRGIPTEAVLAEPSSLGGCEIDCPKGSPRG